MPDCSLIIPLFNKVEYTERCLQTIVEHTDDERYEVVLVDNGSTDGTAELLDHLDGDVVIIRNRRNQGYAVACNQGAAAARTDQLVFVNNDIEVFEGWLEPLLETLAAPAVGAVGAKLLFPDGTLQHAGVDLVWDDRLDTLAGIHRWYRRPADLPEANELKTAAAVTGAVLAVARPVFESVGAFDTAYWNGNEDVDLCLSIWETGLSVVYDPRSVSVHHESVSGPERFTKVDENVRRLTQRWRGRVNPDLAIGRDGRMRRLRPSHPLTTAPVEPLAPA